MTAVVTAETAGSGEAAVTAAGVQCLKTSREPQGRNCGLRSS